MIERYSRPEMSAIWGDDSRYNIWLEVELLALEAMATAGLAPKEAAKEVRAKAKVSTPDILEIEKKVHHDVIAFLTSVAKTAGPNARFLHRGMTSNDLLDTTFAVQLAKAGELITQELESLLEAIKKRAYEHKLTPCIGRSHGIHAEPISFGVKLASWYAELNRQKKRFLAALEEVTVGKLSGPVGTYASLPPEIEATVLEKLNLTPETVATQVVSRDRHATFFSSIAQIGGSLERFCVEIRHLQRTEVGEVAEPFGSSQKGSSAMPHKKNPILTENMTGLARLLRSYSVAALENVALWHERDISHSSVERVIAPDATILLDFCLARFRKVVEGLVVNVEKMQENIEITEGKVFSGTLLLALVDAGVSREDGYKIVQDHALSQEGEGTFKERVLSDSKLSELLGEEKIAQSFSLEPHLKHTEMIFERTFS